MTFRKLLLTLAALILPNVLAAQRLWLEPAELLKPLADSWPTYSGDYSGKRYSSLTQLNRSNIKSLTLAWTARVSAGPETGGRGGGSGATIIGGEGPDISI